MRIPWLIICLICITVATGFAQTLQIVSTSPAQNQLDMPAGTDITATFDIDMDPATSNDSTFIVSGRSSGPRSGTISYDGPSRTATFDPAGDFQAGEAVNIILTDRINSSTGDSLVSGYTWQFAIETDD